MQDESLLEILSSDKNQPMFTSKTVFHTISSSYNLVFLVDVSLSMSTIGVVGDAKSLFSIAFET